MNALRFSTVVLSLSSLVMAAAAMGWGCGPTQTVTDCSIPTLGEVGSDGGPDPCHCDPSPDLAITTCPCLAGTSQDKDVYLACMATYRSEMDGGSASDDGGPIGGACDGQCWPIPPPGSTPLLLWIGPQNEAPICPTAAPTVIFDGNDGTMPGLFALGCTSSASGACRGLGQVCAPATADPFRPCVEQAGDADCVSLGPYSERHLFFAAADQGQPILPSTFCCSPSPLQSP